MVYPAHHRPRGRYTNTSRSDAGFTMMELIVALSVLGTATWVFISLYGQSLTFASTSSHRTVATQVAEARLNKIISSPEEFLWGHGGDQPAGTLFEIRASSEKTNEGNPVTMPALTPVQPRAAERTAKIYDELKWKAYGRFPTTGDAEYVEVIVRVEIEQAGRKTFLALTSSIPASRLPEGAPFATPSDGEKE